MKNVRKMVVALLLVLAFMVPTSCDTAPSTTHTQEPDGAVQSTQGDQGNDPGREETPVCAYPYNTFTETPTRLLYVEAGVLRYYNKITGECREFCFDPLCRHDDFRTCISQKFMMAYGVVQSVEYSAYDNRFYVLRGEQFMSFSFDGSDLKSIWSSGEIGKLDSDPHGAYLPSGTRDLSVCGERVYFIARNKDSGKTELMCYNVREKAMSTVFADGGTNISAYICGDSVLYLDLAGTYSGVYRMEPDGSGLTQITAEHYLEQRNGIFDGERLYFVGGQSTPAGIMSEWIAVYTPQTDTFETVMEIKTEKGHRLLAVRGDFLYYTIEDPIAVGERVTSYFTETVYNRRSRIYRLDMRSGEVITVLDDLTCSTENLYFLDDAVVIYGQIITSDSLGPTTYERVFTARIDENGMLTELTPTR